MANEELTEEEIEKLCPIDPRWVSKMLAILPSENRGKLAKYSRCPSVRRELKKIKKGLA